MNTHHSSCPIVRDELMTLWESVEAGGGTQLIQFQKRILWLRESETQIVLRWDGQDFKEKYTFNDWYGYLTSLEGAIGYDIAKAVEADVKIKDIPVLEDDTREGKEWNARKGLKRQYRLIYCGHPDYRQWFTSDKRGEGQYAGRPILEEKTVLECKGIYTSRNPKSAEDAARFIAGQRAQAKTVA